ncbi:MAG: DUF1186 domain-containing protein [Halofilum sp. (in: g-proteobacteria)]
MEPAEEMLQRALEILRAAGTEIAAGEALWADLPSLLRDDGVPRLLVAHVAGLDEAAVDGEAAETRLLECLLDEARRAGEDGQSDGPRFLAAAEAALDSLDSAMVDAGGIVALSRVYHRAGLAVPAAVLRLKESQMEAGDWPGSEGTDPAGAAAGLAESLEVTRRECGGDPSTLYRVLGENMASLSDAECDVLAREIAGWADPVWQHLSLYWLLDPRDALRRAAAGAIQSRVENGGVDGEVAGRLAWIRNLLPATEYRRNVDEALAAYRRRNRDWPAFPGHGAIDSAYASVPDGAGAQYLALETQIAGGGRDWCMVLIKSGHGVRDAYVLAGLDEAGEKEVWATLEEAADLWPLGRDAVIAFLATALAENLEQGETPPAGLIDVALTAGLGDLRPEPGGGRDWLRHIESEPRLSELTPQKRGRLINGSAQWFDQLPMLDSWFEDSDAVSEILERGGSPKRQERALREYLETRRSWWAELCLRSALAVRDDDVGELCAGLAVTGLALLDGRELKRIPLMEYIVDATIGAHENNAVARGAPAAIDRGRAAADAAPSGGAVLTGAPQDPGRARLQPLFDEGPVAQRWGIGYFGLHGYLFAIATHPQLVPPSSWIEPLFEVMGPDAIEADDEDGMNVLLGELIYLYNRINEQVMELQPALPEGCTMRSEPADNVGPHAPIGQWARGFSHARETFGHLTDTPIENPDAEPDLDTAVEIATDMIEFLGAFRDEAQRYAAEGATVEQLAATACRYFEDNLRTLCAARMLLQGEEPGDGLAGNRVRGSSSDAETVEALDSEPLTPQGILDRLDEPDASYQRRAMEQAVAQSAAMTPLLLQRLEAVVAEPEIWSDADNAGLLYAMALLGYFREPGAHDALLRLAALPEEVLEHLLGDATTEYLPVVLWQTSGGETAGLKRLLELRGASGYGRGAAAEALGFGALFGTLDRREVSAYLVTLLQDKSVADLNDPVWFGLTQVLLDLYPDEHETALRIYIREDNPDPFGIRESDLDRVLAEDRDSALAKQRERSAQRFPDDVHGYLSHWFGFQPFNLDGVAQGTDPFSDLDAGDFGYGAYPPNPGRGDATKPKGPDPEKKKKKRKQEKKARKTNRKRK